MKKIDDRVTLGLVTGFLASVIKLMSNEIFYLKGIEKKRFGEIVDGIFMPAKETRTKAGILFGTAGDILISTVLGIPLVYLLSATGKDKAQLKGLTLGIVIFGSLRGVLANVGPGKTYPKDPVSNATMSISSGLWGLTAGMIAVRLGHNLLFPNQQLSKAQRLPMVDRNPAPIEYEESLQH